MQREPFKILSFQQQQRSAIEYDAERKVWPTQIVAERCRATEHVGDVNRIKSADTFCILTHAGHGADYRHIGRTSQKRADTKQQAESILIKAGALAHLSFHRTLLREGVSQQKRCGSRIIRVAASRNHYICFRRVLNIRYRKHSRNKRPQLCLADCGNKDKNQKLLWSEL